MQFVGTSGITAGCEASNLGAMSFQVKAADACLVFSWTERALNMLLPDIMACVAGLDLRTLFMHRARLDIKAGGWRLLGPGKMSRRSGTGVISYYFTSMLRDMHELNRRTCYLLYYLEAYPTKLESETSHLAALYW